MDLKLNGNVAVITGGSQGIGWAVAQKLAAEGAHVVLCARDAAQLATRAATLRETYGVEALDVAADVTQPADLERLVNQVEATFDGADILINNAGIGSDETIMAAPDARWQYYWELHVMAAVRLARGLVPGMRRRSGGVILNNASICARQPLGHEPIYNVTKAALAMLSKCMSNEFIGDGIRVNCINPGLIRTAGWTDAAEEEAAAEDIPAEQWLQRVADQYAPIGRFASPEELADFFVFLCSPRASYCVGATYYVDGGWLRVVT
jgi:NAD(P)-dependent dehydrogenase (short-subunit alcohol dehydrogenase family)